MPKASSSVEPTKATIQTGPEIIEEIAEDVPWFPIAVTGALWLFKRFVLPKIKRGK